MRNNRGSSHAGTERAGNRQLAAHYQFWAGLSRATARALAERDLIGPAVQAADAAARFHQRALRVAAPGSSAGPSGR